MDVNSIVKEINKSISSAKNQISIMSEDEKIELRAELEAKKTYFGKWTVFMAFFAGVLAILALKSEGIKEWAIIVLFMFNIAVLIMHCVTEFRNAKIVRALSILNDCIEIYGNTNSLLNNAEMEHHEQLNQRQ